MTNDNRLAERVTNPDSHVPKTYLVDRHAALTDGQLQQTARRTRAVRRADAPGDGDSGARRRAAHPVEIVLTEGRNRQVRRMVEALGATVLELVRVKLGPLVIGTLPIGKWRMLTRAEIAKLLAGALQRPAILDRAYRDAEPGSIARQAISISIRGDRHRARRHARAWRSRAPGGAAYLCVEPVRAAADAPARAGPHRGRRATARASRIGFGGRQLPPGRPRPRLGANPHRGARRRVGGVGRLQTRRRPRPCPVRAGALRYPSSPRHVRAADLPLGSHERRHRRPAAWWRANAERGLTSIVFCYTIGKAQRLLAELMAVTNRPVLVRDAAAGHRRVSGGGHPRCSRRSRCWSWPRGRRSRGRAGAGASVARGTPWMRRLGRRRRTACIRARCACAVCAGSARYDQRLRAVGPRADWPCAPADHHRQQRLARARHARSRRGARPLSPASRGGTREPFAPPGRARPEQRPRRPSDRVRPPLRRPRRHQRHLGQGRGDGAMLRAGARGRRRMGRLLPDRRGASLRLLPHRAVGRWAMAATGLDDWLLGECYAVVGDGAETARHSSSTPSPPSPRRPLSLAAWLDERILPCGSGRRRRQQTEVLAWITRARTMGTLHALQAAERRVRAGVSQTLVIRAVAQAASLPVDVVAARLTGDWEPSGNIGAAP